MQKDVAALYNNSQLGNFGKAEWGFLLTLCASLFLMAFISDAQAAGASLGNAICQIAAVAQGQVAKGIATIAVIMLGIGAMLGKVSWSMALLVAVGIAVVFNAGGIVTSIFSGAGSCGGVN